MRLKITKVCPACGNEFHPTRPEVVCCSNRCAATLRYPVPANPLCPICGTPIPRRPQRNEWRKACSDECERIRRHRDEAELFWSHVDRSGGPDACWPWTASTSNSGYGNFFVVRDGKRRTITANRYALMTAIGEIPDDQHACHDCPDGDNPLCCNPAHLFPGTPKENTQDMIAKGRSNMRPPSGARNPNAKLSEGEVREILHRHQNGESNALLAKHFGVTGQAISSIVKRETWKHVNLLDDDAAASSE